MTNFGVFSWAIWSDSRFIRRPSWQFTKQNGARVTVVLYYYYVASLRLTLTCLIKLSLGVQPQEWATLYPDLFSNSSPWFFRTSLKYCLHHGHVIRFGWSQIIITVWFSTQRLTKDCWTHCSSEIRPQERKTNCSLMTGKRYILRLKSIKMRVFDLETIWYKNRCQHHGTWEYETDDEFTAAWFMH